jgi:hypothetical protein
VESMSPRQRAQVMTRRLPSYRTVHFRRVRT